MPDFKIPSYNPYVWFNLYEKWCKISKITTDEDKLLHVDFAFDGPMVQWFADQDFNSWFEFKAAFLDKETKKMSMRAIIKELNSFKRKKEETIEDYVNRFNKLYKTYLKQSNKNNAQTKKPSIIDETDKSVIIIPEASFVEYFVQGITPSTLRFIIKTQNPCVISNVIIKTRKVTRLNNVLILLKL
jgi:hypothetical protein